MNEQSLGSSEWTPLLTAISHHQTRSALNGSFLRDSLDIEHRLGERKSFYQKLHDGAPSAALAELAASIVDPPFGSLSVQQIEQFRSDLSQFPIRFTSIESPYVAAILARSFARVYPMAFPNGESPAFLFATDSRYRPHASVQEWDTGRYLVLMGQYALIDAWMLADIVSNIIVDATSQFGTTKNPWEMPGFADAIVSTARNNPQLHHQVAYAMCAASEGERYRIAVSHDEDLAKSSLLREVRGEVWAGAVDFLVGHELEHAARGHTDQNRAANTIGPSNHAMPWYGGAMFEGVPRLLAEEYLQRYWPTHRGEIQADLSALVYSSWDGKSGAADLRLIGAEIAVSLIAFTDRAKYWLDHGRDPADLLGLHNYGLVGLLDLVLPKTSHPWGKTRQTSITSSLPALFHDLFTEGALKRKMLLMGSVADLLGSMSAQALQVARWIGPRKGEFMAIPFPHDQLLTMYWKPDFILGQDEPEETISKASKFYADISPELQQGIFAEMDYRAAAGPLIFDDKQAN